MNYENTKFTPTQLDAIALLGRNPSITRSEISRMLNINSLSVAGWMANKDFSNAVFNRYMEAANRRLPIIMEVLFEKAASGHYKSIELVLKQFNRLASSTGAVDDSSDDFETFRANKVRDSKLSREIADPRSISDNLISPVEARVLEDHPESIAQDTLLVDSSVSGNPTDGMTEMKTEDIETTVKNDYISSFEEQQETAKKKEEQDWIRRAKAVKVTLLSPNNTSEEVRAAWEEMIIKRELELNINTPFDSFDVSADDNIKRIDLQSSDKEQIVTVTMDNPSNNIGKEEKVRVVVENSLADSEEKMSRKIAGGSSDYKGSIIQLNTQIEDDLNMLRNEGEIELAST